MRVLALTFALSCALLSGAAQAGGDPASRTAMEPRNLAAVVKQSQPVTFTQAGFDTMAESLERARQYERQAKQRGAELIKQPKPSQPENTLPGKCVPFKVPAPHKSMQDYCRALQRLPWK